MLPRAFYRRVSQGPWSPSLVPQGSRRRRCLSPVPAGGSDPGAPEAHPQEPGGFNSAPRLRPPVPGDLLWRVWNRPAFPREERQLGPTPRSAGDARPLTFQDFSSPSGNDAVSSCSLHSAREDRLPSPGAGSVGVSVRRDSAAAPAPCPRPPARYDPLVPGTLDSGSALRGTVRCPLRPAGGADTPHGLSGADQHGRLQRRSEGSLEVLTLRTPRRAENRGALLSCLQGNEVRTSELCVYVPPEAAPARAQASGEKPPAKIRGTHLSLPSGNARPLRGPAHPGPRQLLSDSSLLMFF